MTTYCSEFNVRYVHVRPKHKFFEDFDRLLGIKRSIPCTYGWKGEIGVSWLTVLSIDLFSRILLNST